MNKDKASETLGLGAQRLLFSEAALMVLQSLKPERERFLISSSHLSSWELTLQPRGSRGIRIKRLGFPFLSQNHSVLFLVSWIFQLSYRPVITAEIHLTA